MVKDLIHHFTLVALQENSDGVIPISDVNSENNLLDEIINQFEQSFGEDADDRLIEADRVLGSRSPDEEAYPNLRAWLEDDLFDYHVSTFDRTPILWRLTSTRLVSDPTGEGFACLLDYHQLDDGLFDRLSNRYLEPRKALLRERRSAANRRRNDESLPTSEQAAAAETYTRCESGLEQIAVLEDRFGDLAEPTPRDWPAEAQETAAATAERVAEFRDRTADRLDALDSLAARDDVDMTDLFSPSFYETVEDNREEWLDALDDLEAACRAYAADGTEPVDAHLYDLFDYYDDLVGSDHYASNGILFPTYYYDGLADEIDTRSDSDQTMIGDSVAHGDGSDGVAHGDGSDGVAHGDGSNGVAHGDGSDGVDTGTGSGRRRLIADLASDLGSYVDLAAEIGDACEDLAAAERGDWAARARAEITTAGYRPNRKHGVAINVAPLVDAEIVPKTVDDHVV
ncbi:hypothetical protein GCM10028858_03350 [Halorubrum pallidum]